jgi:hypothetical protein
MRQRRLVLPLLAAAFAAGSTFALEVEDSSTSNVQQGLHDDLVTIGDQRYVVTDYSLLPEGGFEAYDQVPPKFAGPFSRLSAGTEIPRTEIIKIIDAHYKETAINYDSIKIRKVDVTWPKYIAGCSVPSIFALCAAHTYMAGTLVTFESNGQNRSGGMTGFQPVIWMVRSALAASSLTDGAGDSRSGKVATASDSQLRAHLGAEINADLAVDPETALRAARAVLEQRGYSVTEDLASGGLVTAARQLKLTPGQADCGKIMGIGFIRDKRTETTVLLSVAASDARLHVRMAVDGVQHVKAFGGGTNDNILTCKSLGALEGLLAAEIVAHAKM